MPDSRTAYMSKGGSRLPAGTYEVEIWHERLPAQTVSVTVGIGEKATVDAEMEVPSS